MTKVYVLHHVHEFENGDEDVKFIGVYSSQENAEQAKSRLSEKPGFNESADGFVIDNYVLDEDHWVEGFQTIND